MVHAIDRFLHAALLACEFLTKTKRILVLIRTNMEKIDLESEHFSGLKRPTDWQFLYDTLIRFREQERLLLTR